MGIKKQSLAEVPDDYEIYKLSLILHKTPDEVREIAVDDRMWLIDIPIAEQAAADELRSRAKEEAKRRKQRDG